MKREIKFRGKCLQSDELVYGDLIHGVGVKDGQTYILPSRTNLAYVKHCDPLDGVNVDINSIGQFTGLKDKNGKEIYEGDIIEVYGEKRIVEFKNAFWQLENIPGEGVLGGFGTETEAGHKPLYRYSTPVIIGNIYENKELIV